MSSTVAGPTDDQAQRAPDDRDGVLLVRSPATGAVVGEVPDHGPDDVAAVVQRARTAQASWGARPLAERIAVVDRFRRRLTEHRDMVAEQQQAETAKTWEDCQADIMLTTAWMAQAARHAPDWLADHRVGGGSVFSIGRRNTVQYEPLGVVGVIGPWNAPLSLTIGDAVPALLAGNAVVAKPSELTPLCVDLAVRFWLESGGPPDVLALTTGGGRTGAALVDHVDFVHFTGSVATGRKVAARAGERLIGCSLELGGKDAMIVLADADLERAAAACVHNGLFNTGQICISVERVYVEAAVHDRFVDLVASRVRTLRQGVPTGPGSVDLSTFVAPTQVDVVRGHVADAVERGARVVTGGRTTTGPATFHQPTVLADVDHSMRCMTEETFGPTIPIMRVTDADQAVELANDSDYGLAASIWSADTDRAERLARRIEAGTVTVNDATFHLGDAQLPMHGWKTSGLGGRNGQQGMRRFTHTRVVQVASTLGDRDPGWLPYDPRRSRLLFELYNRALALPSPPSVPTPGQVVRGGAALAAGVARRLLPGGRETSGRGTGGREPGGRGARQ